MRGLRGLVNRIWNGKPEKGTFAWDAGRVRKRDPDFVPIEIGPNAMADKHLPMVRRRSRYLSENHPVIQCARNNFVNNVVGDAGVVSQPATQWSELNKRIADRWWEYMEGVDIGREMTGAQQQRQLAGEMFDGGDCLVSNVIAPTRYSIPQGPAVELFPAEQVDFGSNNLMGRMTAEGHTIRQGVEYDALGRRMAYHVFKELPCDGAVATIETRRIPASDAVLAMFRQRPGQLRGVPLCVAAIETTREQGFHKEANMMLAAAAAMVGIYYEGVTSPQQLNSKNPWPIRDANGNPLVELKPGMIGAGPSNVKPHVIAPNVPGSQYGVVQKLLMQLIAAATGVSYSEVSGDYSDATFSSERARSLYMRKIFKPAQLVIGQVYNRPVYRAFIRWEITFGSLRDTLTSEQRAAWAADPRLFYRRRDIAQGWEWVNPQQEAQAAEIEIGIGTRSIQEICASRGRHWQDVIDEQLEAEVYEAEMRKAKGLPPRVAAPVRPASEDVDKPPSRKRDEAMADLRRERESRAAGVLAEEA